MLKIPDKIKPLVSDYKMNLVEIKKSNTMKFHNDDGELIDTIEYDYPDFHLSMGCYWCSVVSGDLVLKEHEAARWLGKDELMDVEWLPADVELIGKLL